jgi:RNA binding exosome subunit
MAHGESNRPIETVDGKPLDSSIRSGERSISVHDGDSIELLETLVEESRQIKEILQLILERIS